jgi:hypothetical protein
MNAPRQRSIAIVPIFIFSASATAFLLWFIFTYLFDELSLALQVVIVASSATAVLILVAGGVFWAGTQKEHYSQAQADTQLKRLAIDELKIRIVVQGRTWHTAPAGHQVYLDDAFNQIVTPMHLQPGQVNGRPLLPSDIELEHWRLHQLHHPTGRPLSLPPAAGGLRGVEEGQADTIPDLLKTLAIEQRICLEGPSGSGKSSLGRHIVSRKLDVVDQIIVCDPQGSRPKWGEGIDAVGFGERYHEILDSFRRLEWVHKTRIEQIAQGHRERDFPIIFVVIEEVPDLVAHFKKQKVDVGYFLKMFLRKTRKTGIDIMLVTQVKTVKELDLEGNSKAMDAFAYVKTFGKDGRGHRVQYTNEFGEVYEYDAPPLWPDSLPVGLTADKLALLPPAPTLEEIAIIDAIQANPGSAYAKIAKLVGLSNSTHSNEKIRSIIARFGLERYEIGMKNT